MRRTVTCKALFGPAEAEVIFGVENNSAVYEFKQLHQKNIVDHRYRPGSRYTTLARRHYPAETAPKRRLSSTVLEGPGFT
jgi:hypothetical protein